MKSPGGEGGGRGTTTPARLHETRGYRMGGPGSDGLIGGKCPVAAVA